MKTLFFTVFLILSLAQAQSPSFVLDSVVNIKFDNLGLNPKKSKSIYNYDARGNLLAVKEYIVDVNGVYFCLNVTHKTYDAKNRVISQIDSATNLANLSLRASSKLTATYDDENNSSMITSYYWDRVGANWYESSWSGDKKIYDANKRLVSNILTYRNRIGEVDSSKEDYSYGDTLQIKTTSSLQTPGKWKMTSKEERHISKDGRTIAIIFFTNIADNEAALPNWDTKTKYEYVYNVAQRPEEVRVFTSENNGLLWQILSRHSYVRDGAGELLYRETAQWDETTNKLEVLEKVDYEVDENILMKDVATPDTINPYWTPSLFYHAGTKHTVSVNAGTSNLVTENSSYFYSQNLITSLSLKTIEETPNLFPNPCTDVLYVLEETELYDMSGNQVTQGDQMLQLTNLKVGTYIAKSKSGSRLVLKER